MDRNILKWELGTYLVIQSLLANKKPKYLL